MLPRLLLLGVAFAFVLTSASESMAGPFRRRASVAIPEQRSQNAVQMYTVQPVPTVIDSTPVNPECPATPSEGISQGETGSASDTEGTGGFDELAKNMTVKEKDQFKEMATWNNGAWFYKHAIDAGLVTPDMSQEELAELTKAEMIKHFKSTAAAKQSDYDSFKKETAPLTADEVNQFMEMVKSNWYKPSDYPSFESGLFSERAAVYKSFKDQGAVTPELTPEELSQFLETVKANKDAKKNAFNDSKNWFQVWQQMTPAQRKAIYEARGK